MAAYKIVISTNDISSASCDLHDIISCLSRRKGLNCLQGVKKFLESLSSSCSSDEDIEVEVDSCNLESCIEQLVILVASLDEETRNESKDDEDSETTIEDCVEAVLDFLKSLRTTKEPTMSSESKMYEEVAINLAEIVKNLKNNYPKTLDKILLDIDLSDEALEDYLGIVR